MMIEYLKIEISPSRFAHTEDKQLSIQIKSNGRRYERTEICAADDLTSFFDQIFDCAKTQIKQALKGE